MRGRRSVLVAALGLLGCGSVSSTPDAHPFDAATDTPAVTTCDPAAMFDPPAVLTGLASAVDEVSARLSPDELTLYFAANPGSSKGGHDLYVAQRGSIQEAFGQPASLTALNTASEDYDPTLSADGLTLVWFSRQVASEGYHLYVSTRTSTLAAFERLSPLAGVASPTLTDSDIQPFLTADGQELWFASNRGGGSYDIYRATRSGAGFANPAPVRELNTGSSELLPMLSADRLTVYFASDRGSATSDEDIWAAHRSAATDDFQAPVALPRVNTTAADHPSWLSPDNCRLYLNSNVSGNNDIYVASRHPR